MSAVADTLAGAAPAPPSFGHRLAPAGDPLEGASFDQLYTAKIEPELVKREAERQRAQRTFLLSLAGAVVLVYLENLLSPVATGGRYTSVAGWLAIATVVVVASLGYRPLAAVGKNAKVAVLQALCGPLGIVYAADGKDAPAFAEYRALNLLPAFNEKAFQDFFTGRRGEVDFSLCEAVLHAGSGKSRHVAFQGQLFRLVTPRRLASTTVVLRNSGWANRFECPSGLQPVGLEDPTFNKAFCVFGSDQVEAREILTPTFMERLDALEASYAAAHIRCAFTNAELLIAFEAPNRFEIGNLFSNLVQRERVEAIARNLDEVFQLIDEFRDV
jgi:hypothetical protein